MTDRKQPKRRKFAHEILGLIGISALFTLVLFLLLINIAAAVAEVYCFENDILMTEFDWMEVDRWIFGAGAVLAVCAFSILFLTLLGERMAYIHTLTQGIDAMGRGQAGEPIPLEGNNELTELADAINAMSAARQQMEEKERALAQEKDQLVRALSHDIRTPLTSILAYTEYLQADTLPAQEQKAYLQMIQRKAYQIRELTHILLDGTKRNLEHFPDTRLLMAQLAEEFLEELEEDFTVRTDLRCDRFAGTFDVQELRRIFDNLSSNVRKYADPSQPVGLTVQVENNALTILQTNAIAAVVPEEGGYQLGIRSIRRIAQHYGGSAEARQENGTFEIVIRFSDF